jgi:hypothetical protein
MKFWQVLEDYVHETSGYRRRIGISLQDKEGIRGALGIYPDSGNFIFEDGIGDDYQITLSQDQAIEALEEAIVWIKDQGKRE